MTLTDGRSGSGDMTRVAFLGLGAMGAPMAGRVLGAGHDLRVWNRTPGRADGLVARGSDRSADAGGGGGRRRGRHHDARRPRSRSRTSSSDVDGVAGSIGPDAVLIDMSTVGPTAIRTVTERLRAGPRARRTRARIRPPRRRRERSTILVGGDHEVLLRLHGRARDAWGGSCMSAAAGAGATVKLANNAAGMSTLVTLGEVLSLTDRAGLDPETVLDAIGMGPARVVRRTVAERADRYRGPGRFPVGLGPQGSRAGGE